MPCPISWAEYLNGHTFLINMQRHVEKRILSLERLNKAGYTNVKLWDAVDASSSETDICAAWARHASPPFDQSDGKFLDLKGHPYKQGTLLSHLDLWKHIIDNKIAWATIFEDDIVFHKNWHKLAPRYFEITPKDYGMCYIGHHCGCGIDGHVITLPVYCTHAFILTLEGAKCIYNKMINDKNGVRAIDCLINHYQTQAYCGKDTFCQWYVWNGEMFPDNDARKHPEHVKKDVGLVFQEKLYKDKMPI
jgi:hypothetical protein